MSFMELGYGSGDVSPAHSQCVSCPIDCVIGKKSQVIGICIPMDLHLALNCSWLTCNNAISHLLENSVASTSF